MEKRLITRLLDFAVEISGPIQCESPIHCEPQSLEKDPDAENVCDVCRMHWFLVTAHSIAERLARAEAH